MWVGDMGLVSDAEEDDSDSFSCNTSLDAKENRKINKNAPFPSPSSPRRTLSRKDY